MIILAVSQLAKYLGILFLMAAAVCCIGCAVAPLGGWDGDDDDNKP